VVAVATVFLAFSVAYGAYRPHPEGVAALLRDAQIAFRKDPPKALKAYQQVLRLEPENRAALDGVRDVEEIIAIDEGK
jgi:hypothetical protein